VTVADRRFIYLDEWVRVRPLFNRHHNASGHCEQCGSRSLAPGWHSVKSRAFRCTNCFDAEREHHDAVAPRQRKKPMSTEAPTKYWTVTKYGSAGGGTSPVLTSYQEAIERATLYAMKYYPAKYVVLESVAVISAPRPVAEIAKL
jgi:hypothetical protein